MAERQRDRETKWQRDRETERQKGKVIKGQGGKENMWFAIALVLFTGVSAVHAADTQVIRLTVLNSMERVGQDRKVSGSPEAAIKAARNEAESFQVVVEAPQENIRVVKAEISDLTGPGGSRIGKDAVKLYREELVRVRKSTPHADLPPGLYDDPLVPFIDPLTGQPIEPLSQFRERWGAPIVTKGYEMYALPFDVFKGQNQPIWGDVSIPGDAAAGVYKGTFTVTTDGDVSAAVPVTVTVWDFTLPDGPTHRNHFGNFGNITRFFGVERDSDRFRAIEMRYCEEMAAHRINPPIPRSLLPEVNEDGSLTILPDRHKALKEFMIRLHVTDFEIPRAPFKDPTTTNRDKTIRYVKDYYRYLRENGWEKNAYYYMHDEPNLAENYQLVSDYGKLVHDAAPGMRCLVVEQTYTQDPSWPDIDAAVDIWCPLWSFIDRKSIDEKIAHGDEVWSYTALAQRTPRYHPEYEKFKDYDPPYWHIDRPLAVYRVPTWINWQYHITGLLYWSTVTVVLDPWNNPAFSHFGTHWNGGGYLFYPGVPCGIDGPVPCMRLKNLRDGMEDYEYFVILEKLAGRDTVTDIVNSVAPDWWEFSKSPDVILAAREKIAGEIVKRKR
ncbi:DUF4091 domain-containing protein [bacterium]|nr:DUF4091 domain-containing protein [bacterium]